MNPFHSRRVRIIEPGWEHFTGDFGVVSFEDGVSVHSISWQEQQRLAGLIRIVSAEEDEEALQLGPAAEIVRNRTMAHDNARVAAVDAAVPMDAQGREVRLAAQVFSREELEDIADRKGIAGLRDIVAAHNLGVKGRSINELINEILEAQANPGKVRRDEQGAS